MALSKMATMLFCLFFGSIMLNAQDPENVGSEAGFARTSALNKSLVTPNSPEASSLGKFGEFNVSAYTGSASLQVPILTIAGKTTSIPINLLYDGTAIKVDQREAWTGVSWNLTANFAITRNIAANPDMDINYYSKKDSLKPITYTDLFVENKLLYDIAKGCIESQPDNFYLSAPFGSAKFYISPNKEVVQKEHQNLIITPFFEADGDIIRFTVKDDKGITYEYRTVEETNFFVDDQYMGDLTPCPPLNYRYNSAWHLTKIIGTNGVEQFLFEYETAATPYGLDINPDYYESVTYNPQNISNPSCCGNANESSTSTGVTNTSTIIGRKHLMNIKYVLGTDTLERVLFESTANPCPYANNTDKRLNRIRCLKGDNGEVNIKDYELKYYTDGGDDCSTIDRLLLKSVQEKSADGTDSKPPYLFAYNTTATLPHYISTQIDHFGYWNSNNQSTLIPLIKLQNNSVALNQTGANRSPNFSRAKVGILEKVTFPTGGYSDYTWEMHKAKGIGAGNYYDYNSTQDPASDREVGGLRIATIENRDCDGSLLTKRSWKYEKSGSNPTNQSSSGIMLNEIRYTSTTSYDYCPVNMWGGGGNCNTEFLCHRTNISATSKSTLGTIKGSHVGYSRVEEIIEANDGSGETSGKTVYLFKNEKFDQFGLKDNVENGLLTQKEIYDADGKILDKAIYTYSTDEGETRRRVLFNGFRVVAKQVQDNKIFLCTNNAGQFFWTEESGNNDCVQQMVVNTKFERRFTDHLQRWVYQSEMTNTRYFYNGSTLTGEVNTTTDYIYGDTTTNQPTETLIKNSDGKVYRTTTHFVNSFDDTEYPVGTDTVTRAMQLKGMTSFPLVQAQYIGENLIYKTKIDYRQTSSNLTLPYKLYEQFPTTGDLLAEVFDDYDGVGNLRQGHRHYTHSSGASQPVTMIYSNENSRMTAQVKNAEIGKVAYTGFETNEAYQGGWNVDLPVSTIQVDGTGLIGNGRYRTGSSTPLGINTLIGSGTYILSYYTNSVSGVDVNGLGVSILNTKTSTDHPNNWIYVEHKVQIATGGGKTNLNLEIELWNGVDELRLYPIDALMTTFNYDKDSRLVGAINDENSLTSQFEYDGLFRLTGVRNFDDHYLSLTEYLYKNNTNANNSIRSWTVLAENQTDTATIRGLGSGDVVKVFSYYDGLGRDLMSASVGTSAGGNDQISFSRYDKFGRQVKQFLPYTLAGNNGAYRSGVEGEQVTFYNNEFTGQGAFAFVEAELESSPLNRVFKQHAAGSNFNSHPTQTEYGANGASQVRDFHIMNMWYPADSLFKITGRDENGNSVITYTDKIGRKIMQDQQGSKTYFLYDTLGLLEQVIQPEAAQKGHDTPMLTYMNSQIQDGSFLYTYDSEFRMKTKIVPNCAAYTYFYDDLDQLVMTQDGNGFKTFTKYDKLGRPVVTGRYKGSATPSTSQVVFEEKSTTAPHYYTTDKAFPDDGNIDIYTVNYYDDYDINGDNSEEVNYISATGYAANDYDFVRGLPIANKVATLKSDGSAPDTYLDAHTFYDQFRRVIHYHKVHHIIGADLIWNKYNFVGWLLQTRRLHTSNIDGQSTNKVINEKWEHDHIGRILEYHHEVEGDVAEKQICKNTYNERDELQTKQLGNTTGTNFLQTVDYAYNIRKWLTSINDPKNLGNDLFGMNLVYNGFSNPNYNGNISNITWKSSSDDIEKTYDYNYDNLNRLTAANYSQVAPSLTTSSDQYNTAYTYDRNGNIETLTRNGLTQSGTFGQIDNLDYTYADDGALTSLAEISEKENGFKSKTAGGTGAYTYDANGNMLTDAHKGMTVEYNYLNLPTKVVKPEGMIEWEYDATGAKLRKTITTDHLDVNINPIFSKEYKASMTVESNGNVPNLGNVTFTAGQSVTLKEGFTATAGSDFLARILPNNVVQERIYCTGFEYFESELEAIYFANGRVKYNEGNSEREYIIADYQGNNRVLFKANGSVAEIIEDYSYYSFGGIHEQESDYNQKYLFSGKELQTELDLGWSDFGVRCFDNWSGKWLGIDILAEAKMSVSPYAYGLGNPIRFNDPSGMIEYDQDGLASVSTDLSGGGRNRLSKGVLDNGRETTEYKQQQNQKKTANLLNNLSATASSLNSSNSDIQAIHFVFETYTEEIYHHTVSALSQGHPAILHMIKGNPELKKRNRTEALKGYSGGDPSPDEYPFASTYEGGAGSSVRYVPLLEQRKQGSQMAKVSRLLNDGDAFAVVPIPSDNEYDGTMSALNRYSLNLRQTTANSQMRARLQGQAIMKVLKTLPRKAASRLLPPIYTGSGSIFDEFRPVSPPQGE